MDTQIDDIIAAKIRTMDKKRIRKRQYMLLVRYITCFFMGMLMIGIDTVSGIIVLLLVLEVFIYTFKAN